ncbi:DUF4470 and zf-MYND domain-containing protein [Phanerochaete sordida]|uniref:DUF4470 and zf-MYND domain-containing protein n=1 Tax=Phanerochaete sordida TaxID=48140 RepID=A0A9P3FZQ4_9APHY|nr:DUF4470 and zf-MYND domain-containing protein [Phanerochaete sordida]
MAYSVVWPSQSAFYPVGNTTPISLLQHTPPEDDVSILLLGCGDPRSILYTLDARRTKLGTASGKFDFTCCDIEPAILARNVLLLTLIADGKHLKEESVVWNMFYHFLLDKPSLQIIITQCEKLVDLSVSLDAWNASIYARFLDIGNTFTLNELRRHWSLYLEVKSYTFSRRKQRKEQVASAMKKVLDGQINFDDLNVSRSAGPAYGHATLTSFETSKAFWKTGTTFASQQDIDAATEVNPTFMYTSGREGFATYPGLNPLAAFHLAPVFAFESSGSRALPLNKVYEGPRAQFSAWCESFYACTQDSANPAVIRVVVADALAFCEALQIAAVKGDPATHPRVSTWRAPLLALDGKGYATGTAPLKFDVIDTSDLVDTLGALNVVLATTPLLKQTPSAALHTETLQIHSKDPVAACLDCLCGDMASLSVLLDITPVPFLAGYTTISNAHELMSYYVRPKNTQFHERLVWKAPSQLTLGTSRPVSADPQQLASLLYSVYSKMFAHEDLANFFKMHDAGELDRIPYTRLTFALLIRALATRVHVDWALVVKHLEELLPSTGTAIWMNSIQEVLTYLHLFGVHSADGFAEGNRRRLHEKPSGPFKTWATVPPVVCVAFEVPRARLRVFDSLPTASIFLYVHFVHWQNTHSFFSFDAAFGTLKVAGAGERARGVITEDARGSAGSAPLVVSVCVPAWILVEAFARTSVRFAVTTTSATSSLTQELGPVCIADEMLLSDARVHVLCERPTVAGERAAVPYLPPTMKPGDQAAVALAMEKDKVTKMTRRVDVVEAQAKTALAKRDTPVKVEQAGACEVFLRIGSETPKKIGFPFSVDATQAKLRVARQSSYVEIVMPPSIMFKPDASIDYRFPLVMHKNRPIPWAFHRVNLERLPLFKTVGVPEKRIRWLENHLWFSFSDREKRTKHMEPLTQMKDLLKNIIEATAQKEDEQAAVFVLKPPEPAKIDTVIFVTCLRFDLSANTIVADAFVLNLDDSTGAQVVFLQKLPNVCYVDVTLEEMTAWKLLLPSLVERCRTWAHQPSCAYVAHGSAPLDVKTGAPPLCACGHGTPSLSPEFCLRPAWYPFVPLVTRVALSPLFAATFLEPAGTHLEQTRDMSVEEMRSLAARARRERDPTTKVELPRCAACRAVLRPEKQMVCSRCKKVFYCSRDCQTKHWSEHKQSCKSA